MDISLTSVSARQPVPVSSRVITPVSMSVRMNSSMKKGLPSAFSRIDRRSWGGISEKPRRFSNSRSLSSSDRAVRLTSV